MQKTVAFEWAGKRYEVEKVRLSKAEEFFGLLERMAAESAEGADKFRAANALLGLMNCPADAIEDASIDELGTLLEVLQRAHFGLTGSAENDAGRPPVAGNP